MTEEDERYLADLLEELFRRIEIIEKTIETISRRDSGKTQEKT